MSVLFIIWYYLVIGLANAKASWFYNHLGAQWAEGDRADRVQIGLILALECLAWPESLIEMLYQIHMESFRSMKKSMNEADNKGVD